MSPAISKILLLALALVSLTLAGCGGKAKVVKPVPEANMQGTRQVPQKPEAADIQDIRQIPQKVEALPAVAEGRVGIDKGCASELFQQFQRRYFAPWTASAPLFDPAESKQSMRNHGLGNWYGVNKRIVPRSQLQELVKNCDLETFPSRFDPAIAVAPAHLRGLPTPLPMYEKRDDEPFDMLSYPQLKLNEPLRVMHASRDGVWLFVESGSSNGWVERRDVALVDAELIQSWMRAPQLVIVRDYAPVSDGRGIGTFRAKIGTILPLAGRDENCWVVQVASAGEGGEAEVSETRIPRQTGEIFPLAFVPENLSLIGDQMLGHPYGWGEIYDLRDCSGLLRDFFMPFGIWLPRTSADQIHSTRERVDLSKMSPQEKEALIKRQGIPFQTLLYIRGHIMLYAGEDRQGEPLIFHDSWSIKVQDEDKVLKKITGVSAITTLTPGKELGLAPASSLLERLTTLGTITGRCTSGNANR